MMWKLKILTVICEGIVCENRPLNNCFFGRLPLVGWIGLYISGWETQHRFWSNRSRAQPPPCLSINQLSTWVQAVQRQTPVITLRHRFEEGVKHHEQDEAERVVVGDLARATHLSLQLLLWPRVNLCQAENPHIWWVFLVLKSTFLFLIGFSE